MLNEGLPGPVQEGEPGRDGAHVANAEEGAEYCCAVVTLANWANLNHP